MTYLAVVDNCSNPRYLFNAVIVLCLPDAEYLERYE